MPDNEQDILAELEQQWQQDPKLANAGTTRAVEGDVTVRCTNSYLNRSQKGRKQMNWPLDVLEHKQDPTGAGTKTIVRWGLETVEDMKRLNTALVNLGIEPIASHADIMRVNRQMQENGGVCFNAKLAENKNPEFPPNVYVNPGARRKDLETGGQPGQSAPPPGAGDKF